jgi:hypothetical protein
LSAKIAKKINLPYLLFLSEFAWSFVAKDHFFDGLTPSLVVFGTSKQYNIVVMSL